jgi:hypothetical protein
MSMVNSGATDFVDIDVTAVGVANIDHSDDERAPDYESDASSAESFGGVDDAVITKMDTLTQIWVTTAPILVSSGADVRGVPMSTISIVSVKTTSKPPAECEYDIVEGYYEVSDAMPHLQELITSLALKGLWGIA